MATRIRLFAAFGALVTAVILVLQSDPLSVPGPGRVDLRSTAAPGPAATTTIKWPVVDTVDASTRPTPSSSTSTATARPSTG